MSSISNYFKPRPPPAGQPSAEPLDVALAKPRALTLTLPFAACAARGAPAPSEPLDDDGSLEEWAMPNEPPPLRIEDIPEVDDSAAGLDLAGPPDEYPAPLRIAEAPAKLDALKLEMPNFVNVIEFIQSYLQLSHAAQAPMYFPPLLLVGPPSVGKTRFCQQLGALLGVPLDAISFAIQSAAFVLTGSDRSFTRGHEGRIARFLLASPTQNGIVLLDEVEKSIELKSNSHPPAASALYELLEKRTARVFVDEYLECPLDASHLNWVATANSIALMPEALLSRFTVFQIEAPSAAEKCVIFERAAKEELLDLLGARGEQYSFEPGVCASLVHLTVRQATRVLVAALGLAQADSASPQLASRYVQIALELAKPQGQEKLPSIGFLH